ncbi:MAG: DNA mismatch repair protein MutS [Bacteroidota bacterium]
MQKLVAFYTHLLRKHLKEYEVIKKKLRLLSASRLFSFACTLLMIYFFREEAKWVLISALIGMGLFLFLVHYYEDTKTKFRLVHALVKINERELKVLRHEYGELPNGEAYQNAQHAYSHDMDLFGQGSFFQYLNRTQRPEGTDRLAQLLTSNTMESIGAKQETIDELAQKPEWRQYFSAQASLVEQEIRVLEAVRWLQKYTSFVPRSMRFVPGLFLLGFVLLVVLTVQLDVSLIFIILWGFTGLGITGRYFKGITHLSQKADRVKATFKQHSKLLEIIEGTEFKSPQLRYQKQRLNVEGKKASEAIAHFSRLLNTMDYNNNIFYILFGNGCALGALWTAYHIEGWIGRYKNKVEEWFDVIAFFEAYVSLGNFSFNHPLFTYPVLTNGPEFLVCKELGHPLIPTEKNIRNNFSINDEGFFIITGSNMAGKSTFLRSVGLCMVMANLGLPVYADECVYSPRKLITSMRSIDSLHKGDSYFLSELKRLKKVVQSVEHDAYFVLLDEILKGTNSHDKAVGSKKFLARLVRTKATGLIATHDLSLCEAAKEYPNVWNYYLDATIENDELYFDYKLKEGVSKTMNASFLLKKMDLI